MVFCSEGKGSSTRTKEQFARSEELESGLSHRMLIVLGAWFGSAEGRKFEFCVTNLLKLLPSSSKSPSASLPQNITKSN